MPTRTLVKPPPGTGNGTAIVICRGGGFMALSLYADRKKFDETMVSVKPLAVADGLAAVTYVRQHAADFGISPDRVGIIGFSAGGGVEAGAAFGYSAAGRPLFVATRDPR